MAAYTWSKTKCTYCGQVERYRGKPWTSTFCPQCKTDYNNTIEIHWGHEKYAGERAGTVERIAPKRVPTKE